MLFGYGCGGNSNNGGSQGGGAPKTECSTTNTAPYVVLNTPSPGATQLSGYACNVNTSTNKIVAYALTNEWYVQPDTASPFTDIASDGSWNVATHTWSSLVILVVDQKTYTPSSSEISNPVFDAGVIASTSYAANPISINFSGYTWGIKTTGSNPTDQFGPGPNFWSNDPSVVSISSDELQLTIAKVNGVWQSGEIYLTQSLGYGTYTVQVDSPLDQLNVNTVASPLFIYQEPGKEFDNEYSGMNGLIPSPNNAQFVVQPYSVPGNIVRYLQPSTSQFTTQMEWRADHITFTSWNGWATTPASSDIIYQWTYTDTSYIPLPGTERVHINLWLLNGTAPTNGVGDTLKIKSFNYKP